ncbi:MAG: C40 family peptidase [Cellulosilyticaceae bacterium]
MQNRLLKNTTMIFMAFSVIASTLLAEVTKEGTLTVTTPAYEVADTASAKSGYLIEGETVDILEEVDNYYKVQLQENLAGYIEKEYVTVVEKQEPIVEEVTKEMPVSESKAPEKQVVPEKKKGEEIVEYAKQFLGTPYVAGGNSLGNGVDCSGFTSQVYKKFGISLNRSSRDQFSSNGRTVSRNELEAGDLVFYGYNGSVNHVAIYTGNDKIVHASTSNRGVVVDPITQRGMAPIIGYKRVAK